jgi:hypothetical protein
MKLTEVPYSKRTEPFVPVDHPDFVWTTGADVQATWRRFGWQPIAEINATEQSEKIFTKAIAHNFTMPI